MNGKNLKKEIRLNKTYKIRNKTIKEVLDYIDNSIQILSVYNKYKYEISIIKNENKLWDVDILVTNEKNIKRTEEVVEPPTLL